MTRDPFSRAQIELIQRARKNDGLLPTHGYNIQTLQILRAADLVRPGALREDTTEAKAEMQQRIEQARVLLHAGDWNGARARLNEAFEIYSEMQPTRYRLTDLGLICSLEVK